MFVFFITGSFYLFKRWTDDGFHFIEECSAESITQKCVAEVADVTPEGIITKTAFRDKAVHTM